MKKQTKIITAYIFLTILIILLLTASYIKFFSSSNPYIEEVPVENSSSKAINLALEEIVKNFNNNEKIKEYLKNNIDIKAILNKYFIYISYTDDATVTYEFSYSNLNLNITIDNQEENLEKFNLIYQILVESVQKRLGNNKEIEDDVISFLSDKNDYDGLSKEISDKTITYTIDITKKLESKNIESEE